MVISRPDPNHPPVFDQAFGQQFEQLLLWRRDVRHFRPDPLPDDCLDRLLDAACLAPSVGNSQPWRFVDCASGPIRQAVRDSFQRCNADALQGYRGEKAALYSRLKLAGLEVAPLHLAVFCDTAPRAGAGLGRMTMPETLAYSVVTAIHTLWLQARLMGIGVGWVSILEPAAITQALAVPAEWQFIAYLCIGWPEHPAAIPELERVGWQGPDPQARSVWRR